MVDAFDRDPVTKNKRWSGILREQYRTAFGVNKEESRAYVFIGAFENQKGWSPETTAEFLYERGLHNAVFFDSSKSTGLIINGQEIVKPINSVPSVFMIKK